MHPLFVALFVVAFWFAGFVLASVFFGSIAATKYIIACKKGQEYVPSRRLVVLWGVTTALIAVVLMAWHLVPARTSRVYVSPNGEYNLQVETYNTMDIDIVRLTATLNDRQSGEQLAKVSRMVRELFLQEFTVSNQVVTGYAVEWWSESDGVGRVVIPDMDTAYILPSGEILHHVPLDDSWHIAADE